jgi:hypothetical protein
MFNHLTAKQIEEAIQKSIEDSKKNGTLDSNPFVKMYNQRLVK